MTAMKASIKLFFLAGVIWIISVMIGCNYGFPPEAGGNTSDVDGIVCGILYGPGGKEPARGASVVMRSRDYLNNAPNLSKRKAEDSLSVLSTVTDNYGFYKFSLVKNGVYCIDARDSSNNRLFIDSIVITTDSSRLSRSDTLKAPATVQGKIPLPDTTMAAYVRVFGLDLVAEVNTDGTFSVENIPEATLRFLITYQRNGITFHDTITIITRSNGTITVDTLFSSPEIVAQSDTFMYVIPGESYTLSVTANGKPHPLYQWYKDSVFLDSNYTGVYTISKVTQADSGIYWCRVVNKKGAVKSLPIKLSVSAFLNCNEYSRVLPSEGDSVDSWPYKFSSLCYIVDPPGGGTIYASPYRGSHSNSDSICITAHAAEGYRFIRWSGDNSIANLQDTTIPVVLKENMWINAFFAKQCTLTLTDSGNGLVTPKGTMSVDSGFPTQISALADPGYELRVWRVISGQAKIEDSTAATTTIRLAKNAKVIGIFKRMSFTRTFGGGNDDWGIGVQQTSDGGYIITGSSGSFSAGDSNVFLMKTDAYGKEIWTKNFSGIKVSSFGNGVKQTSDGGFIITGMIPVDGKSYVILIKTDSYGNQLWTKSLCSTDYSNQGNCIQQTSDGGFIIGGDFSSAGENSVNAYLIKTDGSGNELWRTDSTSTASGGIAFAVYQSSDGGYIVGQYFWPGGPAMKLIKTDAKGKETWILDSPAYVNTCHSVQQTNDGGYIFIGDYNSKFWGSGNSYLVKTDANGNIVWAKTYDGDSDSSGLTALWGQQTTDGGFIIIGNGIDSTSNVDLFLVKTDENGNEKWKKSFGGNGYDTGNFVQQTNDGGYIIIGRTNSSGAGGYDLYLIKTDENGDVR